MGKFIDLTGMKFGRLTVIERAENRGKKPCWLCKCECGNEKVIMGIHLKSGATTSCGCLRSEKNSEKMKEQIKKQWQDEDFRKMKSERMKQLNEEQWKDEDFRKSQSEKMKEQWKDEDFRKVQSERSSEQIKKQWQDEDFRKMKSEHMKKQMEKQWQDKKYRKIKSEHMKKQWQNEEMKKKMGYKGGISTISNYLRSLQIVKQWRKDTYIRENSKCQLTGKHVHGGNSDVHHLKAFSTIVEEAHNLHNIKIKPQVKDYTQEELKLLEEYVGSWHKDTSNAVLLSDETHNLFHSLYRKGRNTPEQFEEFRERYLAGEFKEILK
jgi:hypothetical protein